ncbi:MAG: GGDEF domain-containing protein [Candidatus Sericytochromatia bacterium]
MAILMIAALPSTYEKLQKPLEETFQQEVHLCLSGEAALEWLDAEPEKAAKIELFLLAPDLQGLSPSETIQRIQALDSFSQTPILLLTPPEFEDASVLLEAGAQDLLPYPPQVVEFQARIQTALALNKAHQRIQTLEMELDAVRIQLQSFADIDPLTHLSKRLTFEQNLNREWRRALREQQFLSLLMIDMDLFSAINQEFGTAVGDRCLRGVGDILRHYPLRPGDLSARFTGQQFVVLLPNTHYEGARAVAETLRSSIEGLQLEHEGVPIPLTASIGGVTLYPQDDNLDPTLLLAAADKALLEAKTLGRNIVSLVDLSQS